MRSPFAILITFAALLLLTGESRGQKFTGTSNLDSIACVVAGRNIGRVLENRGVRMDSVRVLLPTILKVHWPISPTNSASSNMMLSVADVHARFVPDRSENGVEGILRVQGEMSFLRMQTSLSEKILFEDSVRVRMGEGLSIEELNGRKYDLVQVIPQTATGIWESTIEPALVILGGAVIVALFFLIRS